MERNLALLEIEHRSVRQPFPGRVQWVRERFDRLPTTGPHLERSLSFFFCPSHLEGSHYIVAPAVHEDVRPGCPSFESVQGLQRYGEVTSGKQFSFCIDSHASCTPTGGPAYGLV